MTQRYKSPGTTAQGSYISDLDEFIPCTPHRNLFKSSQKITSIAPSPLVPACTKRFGEGRGEGGGEGVEGEVNG
ncbi:MAG: hypothetical protein QME90_15095 [Thermodesulfobacteriota bacterium]|nr:hypothetical protein [Thermodesulfobacteriota bacterium]